MPRFLVAGFLILSILLFFSGPSFTIGEGPAVWLFSAQPDRYFPAFFEVHLRRVVPPDFIQSIDLYSSSPGELQKKITSAISSAQLIILMDFSQEQVESFFRECRKISFQQKPSLIAWNCELDSLPDQFQLIPIQVNWDSAFTDFKKLIPDPLVSIVFSHHQEPFAFDFLQSFQTQFPDHTIISKAWPGPTPQSRSIHIVSTDKIMKELLPYPFTLICLESSAQVLSELQVGHLTAAFDFKPSLLAAQIPRLLSRSGPTPTLTLTPQLIVLNTLTEADAYQVLRRCFMCGNQSE